MRRTFLLTVALVPWACADAPSAPESPSISSAGSFSGAVSASGADSGPGSSGSAPVSGSSPSSGAGPSAAAGSAGAVGSAGSAGTGGSSSGSGSGGSAAGFGGSPPGASGGSTGGAAGAGTLVTTCDALARALESDAPAVVDLAEGSVLDCRTSPKTIQACELRCDKDTAQPVFWRVPVGDQTCTTLADTNGDGTLDLPAGKLVNKSRSDFSIKVGSNKTLRGRGSGATLKGVSLDIEQQSNVTIRNIRLTEVNPDLIEAGDGITVNGSKNVTIEHCELSMISDGYIDIRYGSTAVTVAHNHIVGKNPYVCGGQHHYISLVSDSEATFHHNYFDHPSGRNPKVSDASRVHLYSNYYEGISYFCSSAGAGSQILVESNFFRDSRYPHWADGGSIEARGNQYAGSTSTEHRDSNADVFTPSYQYTLDDVAGLPTVVPAQAGPQPE